MAALDVGVLNALRSDLGEELVVEVIALFLDNSPKLLNEMRHAAASADVRGVIEVAHTLKSTSQTLGAAGLAQVCLEIERMGAGGSVAVARKKAALAVKQFESARKALERERTKLDDSRR